MGTKGDGNRQRIIDAADQLFYTLGYNQTSFRDIADETGIPRGNFYYYFKTKDEILDAVVDARLVLYGQALEKCEQSTADPRKRILAFINNLSNFEESVIQVGCPIGTLSSELAKGDDSFQDASRAVFTLLRDWLMQQLKAMNVKKPDDRAMDILARIQGVSVMACAFNDQKYLKRGMADVKTWINSQTLS
jgi:AcrR family transcriptional regulator